MVETVEEPSRFAFRWSHPAGAKPAAGNSCLVEFILSSEGSGRTRLRVVESGLEALEWPQEQKIQYAAEHNEGWATFTGRLANLLTKHPAEHPRG